MNDNALLVSGCQLCELFLNPKENIKTRLYYPNTIDEIPECEFIVLECKTCKVPMIVIRDHVTDIPKELWGKILRECRILFGKGMRLRIRMRTCRDHWHAHHIR